MPFVMLSGLPSSGKTFYTKLLVEYLTNKMNKKVHVVQDSIYCNDKNSIYFGI